MNMARKIILTGDRPTGKLHLGHYVGSLKNRVALQDQYDTFIIIADFQVLVDHLEDTHQVEANIREIVLDYLSVGIDPAKSTIFIQSAIPQLCELTMYFSMLVTVARLRRNPTVKAEAKNVDVDSEKDDIVYGFLGYPVSQAADILLFRAHCVPVGEDQAQHVELCRTLARRFNSQFGETFKIPEVVISKEGARIMGLDDPSKKMSKSAASEYNYIGLTDKPEAAAKKIMKAVTDSGKEIKFDEKAKPAISNLLTIYSLLSDEPIKKLEVKYKGKGPARAGRYGDFKKDLAEVVKKFLTDFQARYKKINDKEVEKILEDGAKKIKPIADETLRKVKEKIGIA